MSKSKTKYDIAVEEFEKVKDSEQKIYPSTIAKLGGFSHSNFYKKSGKWSELRDKILKRNLALDIAEESRNKDLLIDDLNKKVTKLNKDVEALTHGSQFLDSEDAGLIIASLTETYRLNEKLQVQNKNLLNEKREWCRDQKNPAETRTFIDTETGEVFHVRSDD